MLGLCGAKGWSHSHLTAFTHTRAARRLLKVCEPQATCVLPWALSANRHVISISCWLAFRKVTQTASRKAVSLLPSSGLSEAPQEVMAPGNAMSSGLGHLTAAVVACSRYSKHKQANPLWHLPHEQGATGMLLCCLTSWLTFKGQGQEKHMPVRSLHLMCFSLLYVSRAAVKIAGNQNLSFF